MNDGKICVSIFAETADELIKQVGAADELADIIEIRFDYLQPSELYPAVSRLAQVTLSKPVIATYRPKEQGGCQSLRVGDRAEFWKHLNGRFWAADLEEDIASLIDQVQFRICSHHEFSPATGNSESVFERLNLSGCNVVKIAEVAEDACDAIPLWNTFERETDRKAFIPVSMGEAGKWTRILGLAHGAYLTYGSLTQDSQTAPGQLSVRELVDVFRVRELNKETGVYGIIGGSTAYSMSPYIQNAAFRYAELNSVFVPLQVRDLEQFIERMVDPTTREIDLNFRGFAVTIPHKRSIIQFLHHVDETASKIGAANTVILHDGKLHGFNTDAEGFIAPLRSKFGQLKGSRVAVVGAGGAARGCVYALKQEGADVTVFARDESKARLLAEEFSVSFDWFDDDQAIRSFSDYDILVNATPLGTVGSLQNETIAHSQHLRQCRLVYDLVYNPTKTALLLEAELAGVPALNGLEMLIAQGAKQFEIWSGRPAPVDVMKAAALKRLSDI